MFKQYINFLLRYLHLSKNIAETIFKYLPITKTNQIYGKNQSSISQTSKTPKKLFKNTTSIKKHKGFSIKTFKGIVLIIGGHLLV